MSFPFSEEIPLEGSPPDRHAVCGEVVGKDGANARAIKDKIKSASGWPPLIQVRKDGKVSKDWYTATHIYVGAASLQEKKALVRAVKEKMRGRSSVSKSIPLDEFGPAERLEINKKVVAKVGFLSKKFHVVVEVRKGEVKTKLFREASNIWVKGNSEEGVAGAVAQIRDDCELPPPPKALKKVGPMVPAPTHPWGKNVRHCDLKPENILLSHDDTPLLADSGPSSQCPSPEEPVLQPVLLGGGDNDREADEPWSRAASRVGSEAETSAVQPSVPVTPRRTCDALRSFLISRYDEFGDMSCFEKVLRQNDVRDPRDLFLLTEEDLKNDLSLTLGQRKTFLRLLGPPPSLTGPSRSPSSRETNVTASGLTFRIFWDFANLRVLPSHTIDTGKFMDELAKKSLTALGESDSNWNSSRWELGCVYTNELTFNDTFRRPERFFESLCTYRLEESRPFGGQKKGTDDQLMERRLREFERHPRGNEVLIVLTSDYDFLDVLTDLQRSGQRFVLVHGANIKKGFVERCEFTVAFNDILAASSPEWKTVKCHYGHVLACPHGHSCPFAHGEEELRPNPWT